MGRSTGADGAAVNSRVTSTVEYAPDPRGHQMFHNLSAALNGFLTRQPAVVTRSGFSGYARSPQNFRGAAAMRYGYRGKPTVEATASMEDESSTTYSDPALRIFADRLTRQLS